MEFYAPIALALPANRRRMQVFGKARRSGIPDLVTAADIETQRQLKAFALEQGWQFWGEEGDDSISRYDEAKKYLLIADPIEGTNNYVHRKDGSWGSVVALVDIRKREPVAGIVAHPSRKAFYAAAKGEGAYLLQYDSSDRLVSQRAMDRKPELPFFTYNNSPHFSPQLARQARRFMSLGKVKANKTPDLFESSRKTIIIDCNEFRDLESGALEAVRAKGTLYFRTGNEMAAVFVILGELGGRATDAEGKPWRLGLTTMISARKAGDYGYLMKLYAKTCG